MQKTLTSALTILASVVLASGNILAQQNAAPTTSNSAPSTTTSKPKTSTTKRSTGARSAAPLTLKTDKEKFSYALGMRMGANLKKQNVPVEPAILERGLKDAM
ncbi:MAG: hypothetical protein WA252_19580, partial [Candidatus Sulfotelmatobacter sp.]